jgi:hypothetical protein
MTDEPDKLTTAEQKAQVYRTNAYLELSKLTAELMKIAVSVVTLDVGKGKLMVPAAPADLCTLVAGLQHRVQQLEISLQAIVDMLLQSNLVIAVPNPDDPAAAPPLALSNINREQYWLMCGQAAERTAGLFRRGLLSQGSGAILRKQ